MVTSRVGPLWLRGYVRVRAGSAPRGCFGMAGEARTCPRWGQINRYRRTRPVLTDSGCIGATSSLQSLTMPQVLCDFASTGASDTGRARVIDSSFEAQIPVRAVRTKSEGCRRKKLKATWTEHVDRLGHGHQRRGGRHDAHRPCASMRCCPCRCTRAPTARTKRSAISRSATTSPANTVSNSSDSSRSKTLYKVA